ncbi:MAG TPA: TPM domain-containing protein [Sphingomicrobium sp.]|nr:TPM domain-containing protein [Sphingomicrobium sp.]
MIVIPAKAGSQSPFRASAFAGVAKLLLVLLALLAAPAAAQTFPEHGGSPVVDQAGLLRPEQVLDLKSKSEALHARTGRAFAVVTVNSLEGLTVEDYGYRLGRHWQLGDKDRDDGVILLVAPNEKKVRIETGYGAEGFLPDILAGRIIRDSILPKFREGDMAGGIMAGADAIIRQLELPPEEAQAIAVRAEKEQASRRSEGAGFLPVIFFMIALFFVLGSLGRRAGGRRYRRRRGDGDGISPWVILWGLSELSRASRGSRGGWGGGGSWGGGGGGGFGGFGGGGFGGGGASGSW